MCERLEKEQENFVAFQNLFARTSFDIHLIHLIVLVKDLRESVQKVVGDNLFLPNEMVKIVTLICLAGCVLITLCKRGAKLVFTVYKHPTFSGLKQIFVITAPGAHGAWLVCTGLGHACSRGAGGDCVLGWAGLEHFRWVTVLHVASVSCWDSELASAEAKRDK